MTPITVGTGLTIEARAFKTDYAWSGTATTTYTFNYGTLAAPLASPAGGTYGQPQTVTLSAVVGATVRYTVDGSVPDENAALYTTPIAVASSTTLRARAYRGDWTASPVVSELYTIGDTTAPTIVAEVYPTPNAEGWNNTPVTVSFRCRDTQSGVASCPSPLTLTQETAGQAVSGSTTDVAGNSASTSITVKIDMTPPVISTTAPANGSTVSATTVALSGVHADLLSGIGTLQCHGHVVSTPLTCTVALQPGRNYLTVQGTDRAGNARSATVVVTHVLPATVLRVSPSTVTLALDAVRTLTATDQAGQVPQGLVWSVANPAIVALSDDGTEHITGLSPGVTTVTATAGGLSASATVTVLPSSTVATGITTWTSSPSGGAAVTHLVRALPDLDGGTLMAVEETAPGAPAIIRALTEDGQQKWVGSIPLRDSESVHHVMGDGYGGVLLQPSDLGPGGVDGGRRLVQLGGALGGAWTYDSPGRLSRPAVSQNGTVFVVERTAEPDPFHVNAFLVALDGLSGDVVWRVALPQRTWSTDFEACGGDPLQHGSSAYGGAPTIGSDGSAYVATASGNSGTACDGTSESAAYAVWQLTPAGAVIVHPLGTSQYTGPDVQPRPGASFDVVNMVPDENGQMIAGVNYTNWSPGAGTIAEAHLVVLNTEASTTLPFGRWVPDTMVVGEAQRVFATVQPHESGSFGLEHLVAVSIETMATWSASTQGAIARPIQAMRGGDVVVDDGLQLLYFDYLGTALTFGERMDSQAHVNGARWVGLVGGHAAGLRLPVVDRAEVGFSTPQGGRRRTQGPDLRTVINDSNQPVLVKFDDCRLGFQFVDRAQPFYSSIDGFKPNAYPVVQGYRDWFKVGPGIGVHIEPDESFHKTGIIDALYALTRPDCNVGDPCALDASTNASSPYHTRGGRKREPEWSQDSKPWHWDWRHPGPQQVEREARCDP
ncbi:MAG: chitobiase/beta-hexosaminidase C-terminal domain-containing protein [Vicinamibacterales bacterium]